MPGLNAALTLCSVLATTTLSKARQHAQLELFSLDIMTGDIKICGTSTDLLVIIELVFTGWRFTDTL